MELHERPGVQDEARYRKRHSVHQRTDKELCDWRARKKLYVDEVQSSKTHHYVEDLFDAAKKMTTEDKWWSRKGEETVDIVRNMRCAIMVTSGGNLQIEYRNKSLLIGQKDDGTYWVNMIGGQEKHIFYKDSFKEVIALLAA